MNVHILVCDHCPLELIELLTILRLPNALFTLLQNVSHVYIAE
jgi:hypothetical protein